MKTEKITSLSKSDFNAIMEWVAEGLPALFSLHLLWNLPSVLHTSSDTKFHQLTTVCVMSPNGSTTAITKY